MSEFIFYFRTEEGRIERLQNMITVASESILGAYRYEEALRDFPEPTVFWVKPEGDSIGIAPLIPSR